MATLSNEVKGGGAGRSYTNDDWTGKSNRCFCSRIGRRWGWRRWRCRSSHPGRQRQPGVAVRRGRWRSNVLEKMMRRRKWERSRPSIGVGGKEKKKANGYVCNRWRGVTKLVFSKHPLRCFVDLEAKSTFLVNLEFTDLERLAGKM